jgi:toxin-antitoxin system PIN domain toxin
MSAPRQLADVNVLLALVWPRHQAHFAAHTWFSKAGQRGWATNAITQLGAVRLLTNPAVTRGAVSAEAAVEAIREATSHPGHEFWPLDREVHATLKSIAKRLTGHQQWMDALLLVQAVDHDGVLVTFDAGIASLAGSDLKGRVLLLKSR